MFEIALFGLAGFAAGLLNAIAGGGTFLTLPVLIYAGIPPVTANATSTLIALPGYISSAWAFRDDIHAEGSLPLRKIVMIAIIGSLIGAGLLVVTPGDAFLWVIPWLLLLATIAFAAGPLIAEALQRHACGPASPAVSGCAVFAVSVYGGYFNGGLGIMLLATLGLIGFTSLHGMNGLKNLLSAVLSLLSVCAFAFAGLIAWKPAILMAVCATAGGYVGARVTRRIENTSLLRGFVTLVGFGMTVAFFVR